MQKIKLGFAEETESNTKRLTFEVAETPAEYLAAADVAKGENLNAARKERSSRSFVILDENKLIAWLNACGFEHCFGFRKPYVIKTEVKKLWLAGLEIPGCSGLCAASPHRFRRLNKRSRSPPHPP